MAKAHAILSPSAAYRWLACTPSARFEEQIPEQDSVYSAEGTLAHELAALILSSRTGKYKGDQRKFNSELADIERRVKKFYQSIDKPNGFNDMLDYAEDYADYVRSFIPMVGRCEIFIERRVDMSAYAPLCFGTVDNGVLTSNVLYVTDYKYGAGKRVSARRNKQMMLYALGLLLVAHKLGFEPDTVVMSIYQPRVSDDPSTYEIDTADLLDWAEEELAPQALQAIGGQGDFIAGSHCDFCKAKASCKAYYDHFEDLKNISDKRQMTDKDLQKVLVYGDMVASWVKKVKQETVARMQGGHRVKGFKLIAGRKSRKFRNEDDVVDIMIGRGHAFEDMFKSELRGIGDIEGLLGNKDFAKVFGDVVVTVEANPQIVDEDDDRPAIGATGASEYDDEEDYSALL